MTTLAKRSSWLPMVGLALVLSSILTFLYIQTQGEDDSSYFENVALLRQLKQLDARWELDVLKSRMGISANYDSLVDPLVELIQLREKLQSIVTHQQHAATAALANGSESFRQAVQQKTGMIEHFKSHNSVLRNSLAFLPTAADDIQQAVKRDTAGEQAALRQISADVGKVLLDTMVYSQAPAGDKADEIQAELRHLTAADGMLPSAIGEGLVIFAAHVRTVLREQPAVNELLNNIAAVPTAARLDALYDLLSAEQHEAGLRAQQYRHYLLIFAAALAGLLLYAAIRLIWSHAVINRVNRALQDANATLEQRVRERTRELHAAQSELLATARQAGMAEIANNVLHNVGNVLNSVNISAGVVDRRMRDSQAQKLTKVVELIDEHAGDLGAFFTRDKKGKLLPGYLGKLAAALDTERGVVIDELGSLIKSIDHIKDIVASQQSYAGAASVVEAVQIRDLVEDALRMNAGAMARHGVTVVKEFADVPVLLLDKSRVLQILVNLISNAKQAMDRVLDRSHRITLGVEIAQLGDERRLRIRVEDDGEGIPPENLARLFVRGFTSRKNGHGFGLHSCALAAKEMGGTLTAHSDGRGKGAAFRLELPIRLAEYAQ